MIAPSSEIEALRQRRQVENESDTAGLPWPMYKPVILVPHFDKETYKFVNLNAQVSEHTGGLDLPLQDITTLRFFYNLGVQHSRAAFLSQFMQTSARSPSQKSQPAPRAEAPSDWPSFTSMVPSCHASSQRFIRSVHGSYLRIRLGYVGKYRNTCEHWYIEDMNGKVLLRAYCTNGKYLRANPDGFIDLADQAHAWEEWTIVRNSNGTVSFLSHHGTWLRARKNGEVSLGMRCDDDEQFTLRCW